MLSLICFLMVLCCINVGPTSWYLLSILWGFIVWRVHASSVSELAHIRRYLTLTLLASSAVLLKQTDVFSDDAHRYRWDGWVALHGINPYAAAPTDSSLRALEHYADAVHYPESINNNSLKTIYPPGAQHLFAGIVSVCGTGPIAFKVGWLILCMLLVGGTLLLLRNHLRQSVRYLLVLTSPIYLLHGFMDIHVDTIMGLVVAYAIALVTRGGWFATTASMLYGYAVTLKYVPIVIFPAFVTYGRPQSHDTPLMRTIAAATTIAIVYAPFYGSNVFGSLGTFAMAWQANSLLAWCGNLIMDPQSTRIVLMGLAGATTLYILRTWKSHTLWASSLCVVSFLVFSPVVHPWYIAMPLMVWVLAPSRTIIVWTITMCVYAYTYTTYKGNGVWYDHPIALVVEFVPVGIALLFDVYRGPLLFGNKDRMGLAVEIDRESVHT